MLWYNFTWRKDCFRIDIFLPPRMNKQKKGNIPQQIKVVFADPSLFFWSRKKKNRIATQLLKLQKKHPDLANLALFRLTDQYDVSILFRRRAARLFENVNRASLPNAIRTIYDYYYWIYSIHKLSYGTRLQRRKVFKMIMKKKNVPEQIRGIAYLNLGQGLIRTSIRKRIQALQKAKKIFRRHPRHNQFNLRQTKKWLVKLHA